MSEATSNGVHKFDTFRWACDRCFHSKPTVEHLTQGCIGPGALCPMSIFPVVFSLSFWVPSLIAIVGSGCVRSDATKQMCVDTGKELAWSLRTCRGDACVWYMFLCVLGLQTYNIMFTRS